MQIILAISDKKGKNILFILDNLMALPLDEIINYIKLGKVTGVNVVKTKNGSYVRSNPNATKEDNLDSISLSISALTSTGKEGKPPKTKKYHQKRNHVLKEKEKKKEKIIYLDGKPKKTEKEVISHLSRYKAFVRSASEDLKVDKYLLGAILIDEYLRKDWVDEWADKLAGFGRDSSVGVAQVKVSTAKDLIRGEFYNPEPKDKSFSPQNINKLPSRKLYKYLDNPEHSIYFAGAKINMIIKAWSSYLDLREKPEILATLYSLSKDPHSNPHANDRGKQIAGEFYKIAKRALR